MHLKGLLNVLRVLLMFPLLTEPYSGVTVTTGAHYTHRGSADCLSRFFDHSIKISGLSTVGRLHELADIELLGNPIHACYKGP